jgi:O-antigen/teichoic acid export membrane protein
MVLRLFGPGFEQGYPVLLILTLGQLLSSFVGPVANLLNMTGHHILTARVQATGAILAIVFGLVFTRSSGSVGTAVAFSAATALGNAWLTIFVVHKLEIYPSVGLCLRGKITRCSKLV